MWIACSNPLAYLYILPTSLNTSSYTIYKQTVVIIIHHTCFIFIASHSCIPSCLVFHIFSKYTPSVSLTNRSSPSFAFRHTSQPTFKSSVNSAASTQTLEPRWVTTGTIRESVKALKGKPINGYYSWWVGESPPWVKILVKLDGISPRSGNVQ